MPVYEFQCAKCKHQFTTTETFQEHAQHHETCPKCHSKAVQQQMSLVYAKTSRKS
jgi:putative FmdB family regulatory protein